MTVTDKVLEVCELRPGPWPTEERCCAWCGAELQGRARRWCSLTCVNEFTRQHNWGEARNAAMARDGHRCVKCGADGNPPGLDFMEGLVCILSPRLDYRVRRQAFMWAARQRPRWRLEVNHRAPVLGRHAVFGCHHHLDGLETVCHPCHLGITAEQFGHHRPGDHPSLFDEFDEAVVG